MLGAHPYAQRQDIRGGHGRFSTTAIEQLAVGMSIGGAQLVEKGIEFGASHFAVGHGGDETQVRIDGPGQRHDGMLMINDMQRAC